jgi:gliding motility-associated-like protein
MQKILLFYVLLLMGMLCQGQIIINNTITAQQLAQTLVGSGIQISNVTLTGSPGSYGKFVRNGSSIRLDSGIVLTTGQTKTTGLFTTGLDGDAFEEAGNDNNSSGDASLDNLVGGNTFDACVLEFDFVPIGDSISFRYVFSSEEYPDYNCSDFNDVFAFFISGPGIVGQRNLALIPGTNIPVTINSINDGTIDPANGDPFNCTSMGAGSPFTNLYVDNSNSTTVTHNGFTVVLTARAAVQACSTYRIKLAIADVVDGDFDSGVFLEAGSFNSEAAQLVPTINTDVNGLPFLAEGCNTGTIRVVLPRPRPVNTVINLQYSGTATYGMDYNSAPLSVTIPAGQTQVFFNCIPTVDNLPEGAETVKIRLLTACNNNTALDSLTFDIRDFDNLSISPRSLGFCPTGGAAGNVQLQVNGSYTTYNWTPAATLSNPTIANPIASPTGITTYIVTAQFGNCSGRDSVLVRPKRIAPVTTKNIVCSNTNSDGFIRVQGNSFLQYPLSFSLNNGPFGPDSNFNNLAAGTYLVSLRDATGCRLDTTITLTQLFAPVSGTATTTFANCNGFGGSITVNGSGGQGPYRYSLDGNVYQNFNLFFSVTAGNYTVYIRDANNCVGTIPVTVNGDPPVVITTTSTAASCSGNPDGTITVTATGGSGFYEYSLLGGIPQSSNVLSATSGQQIVLVTDDAGCVGSDTVIVALNNTVTVAIRPDTTLCEGQSITLTTVSNATNYDWRPGATLNDTTLQSPVATPPVSTQYTVTAILGVCQRNDTINITVLPAPIANAGTDTSICFGSSATLRGSGGVSFLWAPAQFLSATNVRNPVATPNAASTDFWVMVTDALGCTSLEADTVTVTTFPAIVADAGRDTVVAINQPLQLQASGSTIYAWSPTTWLNNPNIANPIATVQNDITYIVTVSNAIGCRDTASIRIKAYQGPEIYVPTAFTPDGDGRNDVLRAIAIGFKSFDYFTVFNRYGQPIFSTRDPRIGWDGTFKGARQNQGAYTWMARGTDYRGRIVERRGSTIIIR